MTMNAQNGDVQSPAPAPASAGQAANGGGGSAKKRLLPMELRRRRRAAKLQITAEKDVTTVSAKDIIESLDNKDGTSEDATALDVPPPPRTAEEDVGRREDTISKQPAEQTSKRSLEEELEKVPDESNAAEQLAPLKLPMPQPPNTKRTTPSATKQLQSLFSFSLLDRKRQKLQHHVTLVDVPSCLRVKGIPLDVVPKSKVVITIPFRFPFSRPRALSMAAAVGGEKHEARASPETRWLRALQYFVHPASPLPPSLAVTNEKQVEENDFYVHRFRTWQESFRHAYFGFRRLQHHGTLYVRYPEFIACFYINMSREPDSGPASILDECKAYITRHQTHEPEDRPPKPSLRRICAVISQSNARLRKELLRREIEFRVPFNLRAIQAPLTNQQLHADDIDVQSSTSGGSAHNVHGADSLLRFEGHQAVHGLYEYLLNRKPLSNQDVPEILSSYAFANAAIRSVTVRYMGKAAPSSSSQKEDGLFRSDIELSGFCMPSVVASLISCLEDYSQDGDTMKSDGTAIKVVMEAVGMSERLNAVFLDVSPRPVAKQSIDEREQWKQQLDLAKRRLTAVKKVAGESTVEVEMSTRA